MCTTQSSPWPSKYFMMPMCGTISDLSCYINRAKSLFTEHGVTGHEGMGAREPEWRHLVYFPTTSHSRGESATEQRDRTQEKSLRVKNFPLSEGQSSCLGLCAMKINRTALWWTVRQFLPHRVRPRVREGSGLKREPKAWTQTVEVLFPSLRTFSRVPLTAGPISLGCAVRNWASSGKREQHILSLIPAREWWALWPLPSPAENSSSTKVPIPLENE